MTNDDKLLEQISQIAYPHKVDLTARVMQRIEQQPLHISFWALYGKRIAIAAAASVALAVAVNFFVFANRDYNEPQLCNMIASVYDYSDYNTSTLNADLSSYSLLFESE